jgi:hypothetical protein
MSDETGSRPASGLPGLAGVLRPPALPDLGALMQMHQRNLDTLLQVNALMLGSAQALAQRQMLVMQQGAAGLTGAMQGMAAPSALPFAAQPFAAPPFSAMQAACAQGASELGVMAEMMQKTGAAAAALLERRFTEAMAEMATLAPKG